MVFLRLGHDGVGKTINFLHDLVHGLLLDQVVEASRNDHMDWPLLQANSGMAMVAPGMVM